MQLTFRDGMQTTRALGPVLAYSAVGLAWLVLSRVDHLYHRICLADGVLQIAPTAMSFVVGGMLVCAGIYSTLEALRLQKKGELTHPLAHVIFAGLGVMLLYDRATTSAEFGREYGEVNNGAFTSTLRFQRSELQRVRQAERSASGPSMPVLELTDGRSVQLNWDPLPRAALTHFISQQWGVPAAEWKHADWHFNCEHAVGATETGSVPAPDNSLPDPSN